MSFSFHEFVELDNNRRKIQDEYDTACKALDKTPEAHTVEQKRVLLKTFPDTNIVYLIIVKDKDDTNSYCKSKFAVGPFFLKADACAYGRLHYSYYHDIVEILAPTMEITKTISLNYERVFDIAGSFESPTNVTWGSSSNFQRTLELYSSNDAPKIM